MKTLKELLQAARDEGWTLAEEALPPAGGRVDVMHVLNRSYDCDGEVDEGGEWRCSNAFILPNMMLVWNPTHWRAKATGGQP